MAVIAAEAGSQEGADQLACHFHADHAPAQHQHVHIVMFHTLVS